MGLSPRNLQDLDFVFRGPVIAKALFNRSSGSEDIHTYLVELVPPRSPLEVLRAAATFLNRGPKGVGFEILGGLNPGGGTGHAHDVRGLLSCEPRGSSPFMVQ